MIAKDPFASSHFYHIFNKSMDAASPFLDHRLAKHFVSLFWYYRSEKVRVSYSYYCSASEAIRLQINEDIDDKDNFRVDILAYCIMPNHYHILLRQNRKKGIYSFMNNISNAFTRFYNTIVQRKGPIFIPRYKSRLIHSEEQLIHVLRYIHLNPYSSGNVTSLRHLEQYPFSSHIEYLQGDKLINTSHVLSTGYFMNNRNKYRLFVNNHADYQKSLQSIKYIKKWI
jgi:putative transposase